MIYKNEDEDQRTTDSLIVRYFDLWLHCIWSYM